MKTKYLFLAALGAITFASCTSDEFVGITSDNSPTEVTEGAIEFGFEMPNATRADIYGQAAAELLGNNFYVMGTKADMTLVAPLAPIPANSPTTTLVFDNYLVHYGANTAGQTESNTANWEYVGVVPETAPTANYVKLGHYQTGSGKSGQTIKYWDYSSTQYDFFAFSTGPNSAVTTSSGEGEIGVTEMQYGSALSSGQTAYTLTIKSVNDLAETYITDITKVAHTDFGKEVQLQFKNLGSKVRVALYETVPGYSILASSVKFYTVDNDVVKPGESGYSAPGDPAALISTNTNSFASAGTVAVYFPNVGTTNIGNGNYNKAAATVTPDGGALNKTFGTLANKATAEYAETPGSSYLGRTLPTATFAGDFNKAYYQTVFPVSTGYPLTLRVDYTLIATDGSNETIKVYGAKAVVPSTYTVWQPNYAYTYIFKISDNTNGWTDVDQTAPGLFPITFDAVVTEATDVSGEQNTITTVASPSITTYQQNHDPLKPENEYAISTGKNIYVQVMKDGSPVSDLATKVSSKYTKSFLYKLSNTSATEAMVVDALEKRVATIGEPDANVTGRNNLTLTWKTINNEATSIVNGVDDNPISVTPAGKLAEIAIAGVDAGTYAYVYDYTSGAKTETTVYQPIIKTAGEDIGITDVTRYCSILKSAVSGYDTGVGNDPDHYSAAGAPASGFLYFSITTNGESTTTYSFVSVDGKTSIPAGLLKVPVSMLTTGVNGSTDADDNYFYFETYVKNTGLYAVKVIKVI